MRPEGEVYAVDSDGMVIWAPLRPSVDVSPVDHAVPDPLDRFGVADDGAGLGRGYGVAKVWTGWEQIPSLDDACFASAATER